MCVHYCLSPEVHISFLLIFQWPELVIRLNITKEGLENQGNWWALPPLPLKPISRTLQNWSSRRVGEVLLLPQLSNHAKAQSFLCALILSLYRGREGNKHFLSSYHVGNPLHDGYCEFTYSASLHSLYDVNAKEKYIHLSRFPCSYVSETC